MPDDEQLVIGNIFEDITSAVARNIAHDLRPDAIIAKEFPEITRIIKELEPGEIVNKIFSELRKGATR